VNEIEKLEEAKYFKSKIIVENENREVIVYIL